MYCLMVLIMFACWTFADSHDTVYLIAASVFAVADGLYDIGRAYRKQQEYQIKFHEIVAGAVSDLCDQFKKGKDN